MKKKERNFYDNLKIEKTKKLKNSFIILLSFEVVNFFILYFTKRLKKIFLRQIIDEFIFYFMTNILKFYSLKKNKINSF